MLTNEQIELLNEFLNDVYMWFYEEKNTYLYTSLINENGCKERPFRTSKISPKRKNTKALIEEFIDLIETKENVYFTPNTFYKTKTSGRGQYYNKFSSVLYVDIDNIEGIEHIETRNDIEAFLSQFEFLNNEFYPQYALLSGHGIHLYFCISMVDFFEERDMYNRVLFKLCDLLNGDKKCVDSARILRIPFSYNAKDKDNIIQTKFFKLDDEYNSRGGFLISEMDKFLSPYFNYKHEDERINKALKALQKKKTNCKNMRAKTKSKENEIDYTYILDDERKSKIASYKTSIKTPNERYFYDRINFLENELLPYRNYDIIGFRNSFIFIISKLYQNAKYDYESTLNHCKIINDKFKNPLSSKEILNIVYYTFDENMNKNINIKITNEGIKRMLKITPEEQDLDFGVVFYKEVRDYKRTLANMRSNQRKKIENEQSIEPKLMDIKYMKYFQILEENPNSTNKELATLMEVSDRQVRNIKKKFLELKKSA